MECYWEACQREDSKVNKRLVYKTSCLQIKIEYEVLIKVKWIATKLIFNIPWRLEKDSKVLQRKDNIIIERTLL